jgi:ribonuclease HII
VRSSTTSGTRKGKPRRSKKTEGKPAPETDLVFLEAKLWKGGFRYVAGVDEAGRGPLAGPVVAAAVVLSPENIPTGLDDSKKLTADARARAFDRIAREAVSIGVGLASPDTIDRVNILQASLIAMRRALESLDVRADCIIVDGRQVPEVDVPALAVVRGDSRCASVAAASIVAKVIRDRIMEAMDSIYPSYCFSQNKGYGTSAHLEALRTYGPTRIHRYSYEPVERSLGVSDG